MTDIVIKHDTLSLTQQVLERQGSHATAIGTYLASQGDIRDATGRPEGPIGEDSGPEGDDA